MIKNRISWMLSADFIILLLVNMVTCFGFQILTPTMPTYAASLGATTATVGFATSAYSLAALLSRPFVGSLMDRVNRKHCLILSLVGVELTFLAYGLARNLAALLVIRFIGGLFFGLNTTAVLTMVSFTVPKDKIAAGVGVNGMFGIAGQAIAPTVGIYLMENFSFKRLFMVSFIITGTALAASFFMRGQPVSGGVRRRSGLRELLLPGAVLPATLAFINGAAKSAVTTFLVLLGDSRGIEHLGLFFTVSTIIIVITRPCIGVLSRKLGYKNVVYITSVISIAAMVLVALMKDFTALMTAALLYGFGCGGQQPLLQSMCLESVDEARRGAASGFYFIGADLGHAAGPIAAGLAADSFGYAWASGSMVPLLLVGMAVMYFAKPRTAGDGLSGPE